MCQPGGPSAVPSHHPNGFEPLPAGIACAALDIDALTTYGGPGETVP